MELVKGYQTWLNKSLLKERKVDSRDDETLCVNYTMESILYKLIAINTNYKLL